MEPIRSPNVDVGNVRQRNFHVINGWDVITGSVVSIHCTPNLHPDGDITFQNIIIKHGNEVKMILFDVF